MQSISLPVPWMWRQSLTCKCLFKSHVSVICQYSWGFEALDEAFAYFFLYWLWHRLVMVEGSDKAKQLIERVRDKVNIIIIIANRWQIFLIIQLGSRSYICWIANLYAILFKNAFLAFFFTSWNLYICSTMTLPIPGILGACICSCMNY